MTPRISRLFLVCLSFPYGLPAQVTFDRLVNAEKEPGNWLTYSGALSGVRHSRLHNINLQNVLGLELQWVYQARSLEKFEATPLVVDGILYTVQAPNDVVALDAATGRVFWTYSYTPSKEARLCCGRINRGLAILGDTLFMATIDAHLVAIDAKNGKPLWDTVVAKAEAGYAMTHAPLIVKDKVIVGTAGGEYGIRGFLAAFNVNTGREVWRFYTTAGPGDPNQMTWAGDSWKTGGGSIWVTGSYDPSLDLIYWGTGNPGPSHNGETREGDNLYTDSVVALDSSTGKLKWFYQFSPHDEFDYDSVQIPVLADMPWRDRNGTTRQRKVILWANRNGLFYVLDRATGEFLLGKPFVEVTWMDGFDEKGRPLKIQGKAPSKEGTLVFPGNQGGTNWYSPSYSARTGLFYIPSWVGYSTTFVKADTEYVEGQVFGVGLQRSVIPGSNLNGRAAQNFRRPDEGFGAIRAVDPTTGKRKWEYKMNDVTDAGILTTDSDLLFSGGREGYFFALNARTGALLWKASLGGVVASGPISYTAGGRQFVAVSAGSSLYTFALRERNR
ncbi:MAG: PQQ-dependent dehydrogenase, methanol/ethanol family [Terriglobia bacterium]|nr:MAG: PQQ-dependent dehydrogenase, methanol/ethanol family [Terriglobia bacterium]